MDSAYLVSQIYFFFQSESHLASLLENLGPLEIIFKINIQATLDMDCFGVLQFH